MEGTPVTSETIDASGVPEGLYAAGLKAVAERYAALGSPQDVAEKINEFHAAGVRHIVIDLVGPYEKRMEQIDRFAGEVMPLLKHLR